MSTKQKGGLLEALLREDRKSSVKSKAPRASAPKTARPKAKVQTGGADSYAWHRAPSPLGVANARSHLLATKQLPWETEARSGEDKRAAWIEEVRVVMNESGLNWREALKEASRRRKSNPKYQTVVERVKKSYTGRDASTVKCTPGKKCPGKYTKDVVREVDGSVAYRPNAHNVSRTHLTTDAAVNILRDYYKQRAKTGSYKKGMAGATKAMRQDIGKRNNSRVVQSPCPTKLITVTRKDGKVYQRRVVDKAHPAYADCRSNWLYRDSPLRFDMEGIDAGEGEASPAYGKYNLYNSKGRTSRTKNPSRRLGKK